jgi:DNA repair exonuclease SbcCD ATPase subunit
MKIQAIEIENYGPFFGHHEFKLADRGLVAILGQNLDEPRMNSNGSGKSSLIDALDWSLFGVVPRGDGQATVINDEAAEAGNGVKVVVHAQDEDDTLRIERSRPGGLKLFYNGEDVTSQDVKETQSHIEYFLGVDRTVFHATVLFGQQDLFKFADATDGERIEILTKILRLELVDEWLSQAKACLLNEMKLANKQAEAHASVKGQIDALQRIDDAEQRNRFEAQRAYRIKELEANILELTNAAKHYESEAAKLKALKAHADMLPHAERPPELAVVAHDLKKAREARNKAAQAVGSIRARLKDAEDILKLGSFCQTCKQPIAEKHEESVRATVRDSQAKYKQCIALEKQWADYSDQIEAKGQQLEAAYQKRVQEAAVVRARYEAEVRRAEEASQALVNIAKGLEKANQERQKVLTETNPVDDQLKRRQAEVKQLESKLEAIVRGQGESSAEVVRLQFWIEAFGPKGLKSYILDARLQEMTEAANHWVKMLTGGTYWVRLETQTALKTGALRNKFTIRVFNGHDGRVAERNYKSWSGGQKQRVSLGIDFGLSQLIARRAKKPYDLLILDEVFKHLDSRGRDAVMEMLHSLAAEKSSILVVDHDPEFQSMFENHVTVRMQDWRASIVEGQIDEQPRLPEVAADPEPVPGTAKTVPRRTPLKSGAEKPAGKGPAGGGRRKSDPVGGGRDEPARPKRSPRRKRAGNDDAADGQ